ncbi:hypothetical protein CcaverHIS002_0309230 [Cutaneotrichosporon cavernicola]|uniref:Alkyl transferase n=1 Tax=Cutaneotrichosporon cavernicola TaxID=279322 RepID=A0AA48I6X5_9TREE|nr:uncharacterized protein CcaverHIS019_0309090 [Cutaneotrichosporon cavernicola]BEI83055.1 hypothetical protein CcaverHIS002_0309230 [Cutaneotrichosporon cavernicola]BEI90839.1 hypothetical protein CcaverHIS019_0309090 [Cutaneotrichosporon cavernicola]BEI98618.1 hypothetical protein CcaverHIS631_0309170 [Cutaneotrichosporon cavernicola]BEJ06387.1 hypothetical protein CcaverHIS641_0309090 [Cutaneotrichosporon cavernicola]
MGKRNKPPPIKTDVPTAAPDDGEVRGATRALLWPISALLHSIHTLLTTLLLSVIALGPMPTHIGFVMDGNRRYARSHGQRIARGHEKGSESLKRTLRICLRLNIPIVSVYAFAIDNFRRSPEEVDTLMRLATESLAEICREGGFLQQHSIRLRCIGRMELLKPDMQKALQEMEAATAGNKNGVLNVCGPYASRDEITTAVRDTLASNPSPKAITPEAVFGRLQSVSAAEDIAAGGGALDILIRTSDTKRLSDFMLWQADRGAQVHFVKTYWPDFGLTDLLPILLGWQQREWLRGERHEGWE